jgi:uncharacterized protein YecE (DUF72 family)
MIRVGTCSWTEKTLVKSGAFYPRGVRSAEERLRYYAENYDTVEVDSTYYALPEAATSSLWAARTPEGFVFHVKAYGALTGHGVDPRTLPAEIIRRLPAEDREKRYVYVRDRAVLGLIAGRFRDALSPLAESGKLGLVLFQYPQWFHLRPESLDRLASLPGLMEGLGVAVEFRHGSWLRPESRERVLEFLRRHGLTYVTADEPQYGTLATVPFVPAATTGTAYFRLHGRNRENWLKRGIGTSERFAYLYSEEELRDLAHSARQAEEAAGETYVMFNNCHLDYAVRNSRRMKELLREGRP